VPDSRVLLRLERSSPRLPSNGLSWPRRGLVAAAAHAFVLALLVTAVGHRRPLSETRAIVTPPLPVHLVYVAPPVPATLAAGGGGGGNRRSSPKPLAIPRRPATAVAPTPAAVAPAAPVLLASRAITSDAAVPLAVPGVSDDDVSEARGTGTGGGIGDGVGSGVGSGAGPGVGPGSGGGAGGGVYRLGGGVIAPVLIAQVQPRYTEAALAAHLQGAVMLEVIVRRDGTPDALRVIRSIDPRGLDQEAIAAVRQWKFKPGRIGTTPVDVLVTCVVDFHIH
jgi:TonB family protein